jgi:hypothetical protein
MNIEPIFLRKKIEELVVGAFSHRWGVPSGLFTLRCALGSSLGGQLAV